MEHFGVRHAGERGMFCAYISNVLTGVKKMVLTNYFGNNFVKRKSIFVVLNKVSLPDTCLASDKCKI